MSYRLIFYKMSYGSGLCFPHSFSRSLLRVIIPSAAVVSQHLGPSFTHTHTHTHTQSSSPLLVAARVLSIERHPDADKLSVLSLDAGSAGGDKTVVTNAAAQLEVGDTVVLALPGATLPGGSKAQVSRATVRGVASEGMLCSGADL